MLTLDGLVIQQGDFRLTADFTVPTGDRVAVLGPSGGGKSTLLGAIAGFIRPTRGRILWNGEVLNDKPPGQRPVSILFQENNLFPHMTAEHNIGLGLKPDLKLSESERAQVNAALIRVGLDGLGKRKPAALSGGQQSRVALARMLLRGKPLVLLDEPFAALGPALKNEMLDLVNDLAKETGATVLMVTHNPEDAHRFAPQTILVAEGAALPPQDTDALFANPPKALSQYLGNPNADE